ncbi:MAG TPA: (d)CMP kinase [Levilinea sp.]|nr:(d)CMP kinase [Levilinea sp.]
MRYPDVISIDGPAASGKSTIAELLAERLHYLYFDTGVMYRAITLAALRQFGTVDDEAQVSALAESVQIDVQAPSKVDGRKYDVLLDGEDVTWDIRKPEVDANVSQVSAYPVVRWEMTEQQRRIGSRGNVVMVGRDIGTVVLPDAGFKLYLDASVEERARRRYLEIISRGEEADLDEIETSLQRRDQIDSTRALAPLRPADDAVILATNHLSVEEVLQRVINLLQEDDKV